MTKNRIVAAALAAAREPRGLGAELTLRRVAQLVRRFSREVREGSYSTYPVRFGSTGSTPNAVLVAVHAAFAAAGL